MNVSELNTEISNVIRQVVNNPGLQVAAESRLMDDLGLESIDLLDVSSELENTVGFEVDFKDVVNFTRAQQANPALDMKSVKVQHLVEYLEAKNA